MQHYQASAPFTNAWSRVFPPIRVHVQEQVKRAERQFRSLSQHHQNLVPGVLYNLARISHCADHNQEILQAIVDNSLHMFENVEYGEWVRVDLNEVQIQPCKLTPFVMMLFIHHTFTKNCADISLLVIFRRRIRGRHVHPLHLTWTNLSPPLSSLSETGVRRAKLRGTLATSPSSKRSKDSSRVTNSRNCT